MADEELVVPILEDAWQGRALCVPQTRVLKAELLESSGLRLVDVSVRPRSGNPEDDPGCHEESNDRQKEQENLALPQQLA